MGNALISALAFVLLLAATAVHAQSSHVSRTTYTVAPPMLPTLVKPGGSGGPVEPRAAGERTAEARIKKEDRSDPKPDEAKPAERQPR